MIPEGARPAGGHLEVEASDRAGAWVTEVLDAIAAMGRQFQDDLTQTATMSDVFEISRGVLRRVGDFEAVAFLSMDEEGLGFEIQSFDSPRRMDELQKEIDHQIAEGTFGWSLRRNQCVITPGAHLAPAPQRPFRGLRRSWPILPNMAATTGGKAGLIRCEGDAF